MNRAQTGGGTPVAAAPETLEDAPPPNGAVDPKGWRFVLPRLLGLILFAAILYTVDLERVFEQIRQLRGIHVAAATALCAAIILVKSLRWQRLLRHVFAHRVPWRESVAVSSDATFWGTITPGRLGEFKRALYLKRSFGIALPRGVAFCLVDRGFDVLAVLIMAAAAPWAWEALPNPAPILVLAGAAAAGLVFYRPILGSVRKLSTRVPLGRSWIEEIARDILALHHGSLAELTAVSLISMYLYALVMWVMALELPHELSFSFVAVSVALTFLAGILPVSFFNFGTRELVLIALFRSMGLSSEDAISFSFLFVLVYLMVMASSFALSWAAGRPQVHRGT